MSSGETTENLFFVSCSSFILFHFSTKKTPNSAFSVKRFVAVKNKTNSNILPPLLTKKGGLGKNPDPQGLVLN
jgi:hypothetical protein